MKGIECYYCQLNLRGAMFVGNYIIISFTDFLGYIFLDNILGFGIPDYGQR